MNEHTANVVVTDDQIRHMKDWLLRYTPATATDLAELPLNELIQSFIAYHKAEDF